MTDPPRRPARERYDAIVDFPPMEEVSTRAYALARFTFDISERTPRLTPAEPLHHDLRDERIVPRLKPGTDFWPYKEFTDLVVLGEACAPTRSTTQMRVGVHFGSDVHKQIAVFGRRTLEFTSGGEVRFTPPEPFSRIALGWDNAYGGVDLRAAPPELSGAEALAFVSGTDHPGLYPRNPFGKGYVVVNEPVAGVELPNLEDPNDLLTPARVITRDPARWYLQPLPWCYDWVSPAMFPRYVFAVSAPDAWFPAPEDRTLPEVKRGILMEGYRTARAQSGDDMHPRFFQEASSGMVLREVRGGEAVELTGMHPERASIAFEMPDFDPEMVFDLEGSRVPVRARLHSVILRPGELKMSLVYGADVALPRYFVRGVHKRIPVGISLLGDPPVMYQTPPTVRELLARG